MAEVKMPDRIPDNSNKARSEMAKATKTNPITKGKLKKKTMLENFMDVFFEGTLKEAAYYMWHDLAIPNIKKGLISGIEIIFFGGSSGRNYDPRKGNPNTPYGSYFVSSSSVNTPYYQKTGGQKRGSMYEMEEIKKNYDPRRIVVDDRGLAESVLVELRKDLDIYKQVSVQRLFELVGLESDWTSTSYGWSVNGGGLDSARVRPCPDGYRFELPDPYPID